VKKSQKKYKKNLADDLKSMFDKERFETLELFEWLKKKTQQAVKEQKPYLQLSVLDCLELQKGLKKIFEEARYYQELADTLAGLIKEAYKAYDQEGVKQDKKLREVAKILRLTDGTGKRKPKKNPLQVITDYYGLISSWDFKTFTKKKPESKSEAIKKIKDKYDLQSEEATKKYIQRETKPELTNEDKEFFQRLFKSRKK
jgi:hypothetical protein